MFATDILYPAAFDRAFKRTLRSSRLVQLNRINTYFFLPKMRLPVILGTSWIGKGAFIMQDRHGMLIIIG